MTEEEQLYPSATRELAEQRKNLAPGPAEAFKAFSRSVFAEGAAREDQAVDRRRRGPCDAVPVLHSRTYRAALQHGARRTRSWKPSGSPPRCARGALRTFGVGVGYNRTTRQKRRR